MKLLILTSSTGGGHDLRANAFLEWAQRMPELGLHVEIFKPLEEAGIHYSAGVSFYNKIQKHYPRTHHLYWNFLERAGIHSNSSRLFGISAYIKKLKSYQPDWVISVHPHLNHGFLEIARELLTDKKVLLGTYCGELNDGYGFSRQWVNPNINLFMGATEYTCRAAIRMGMPKKKIFQSGFMLRPESYKHMGLAYRRRRILHKDFGCDNQRPVLLLATGAIGANNHLSILNALNRSNLALQVIALCGENDSLLNKINDWCTKTKGIMSVHARPFYPQLPNLLLEVDGVLTRGGSGTTSEAIIAGCPIIFNGIGGVMPQELLTIKYLKRFGVSDCIHRAKQLPAVLKLWFMQHNLRKLAQNRVKNALPLGSPQIILRNLSNITSN